MTAELLAEHADARAYHADWRDLLEVARAEGGCDALIVDAPYSERTHAGHDGAAAAEDGATWTRSNGRVEAKIRRRDINYSAWSPETVRAFVEAWSPLVRGWIVSMTDDVLFPHWREAMMGVDRQTFQDIPAVIRGMTVRLTGDGPSSWAIHCAVGRSRSKEMARWGTLPGAYSGPSERQEAVGGKPLWLMERLVEDYSRPGDLVVDPCMGAGTTLLAAQRTGRRSIGGDAMREHAELAAKRISRPAQQPLFLAGGR
jgi:hypothetical protein